jgi:hypothetical protein
MISLTGHVKIRVTDADGNLKAEREGNNQVLYSAIDGIVSGINFQAGMGIVLGTDATPPDPTQYSLVAGVAYAAATTTRTTTVLQPYDITVGPYSPQTITPKDTLVYTAQFVMTVAATVCEEGLTYGYSASPTGAVIARQIFAPLTCAINDIVSVSHSLTFGL